MYHGVVPALFRIQAVSDSNTSGFRIQILNQDLYGKENFFVQKLSSLTLRKGSLQPNIYIFSFFEYNFGLPGSRPFESWIRIRNTTGNFPT
jgi:hypothetical protein